MPLTLRRTGLSSPAYRDWLDYVIVEDGRDVGRVYEDRHSRPELRWFWSITVYVTNALVLAMRRCGGTNVSQRGAAKQEKVNCITSADRGAPLPPSGPRCLTPR
jgi:hypothetical protein